MAVLDQDTYNRLLHLGQRGINTFLEGMHGIGKTTMFNQLCDALGYRGAYINVPSCDFFVDWLGIPSPEEEPEIVRMVRWMLDCGNRAHAIQHVKTAMQYDEAWAESFVQMVEGRDADHSLRFLRPKRMEGVEFVFFDELNRESDPRFLDACMEMVQFNQINGQALPDLKLVWAAGNPANSIYKVRELDVPLLDKFGARIFLEGNPTHGWYVARGYDEHIVTCVLQWYFKEVKEENKKLLSPRCLETIMRLIQNGADPGFCLLDHIGIPSHLLTAKIYKADSGAFDNVDLATIQADPIKYQQLAAENTDFCAYYTDLLLEPSLTAMQIMETVTVFLNMTYEYQAKCMTDSAWRSKVVNFTRTAEAQQYANVSGYSVLIELLNNYEGQPVG